MMPLPAPEDSLVAELRATAKELRETHISWVFLNDQTVLKIKKPVNFGFLDFRSRQDRKLACEAEVRLNRRLAPEVYLGVVPIYRPPGGRPIVGELGVPARSGVSEWAVLMRRLRDEDCLQSRLEAGTLEWTTLERLAEHLSNFHAQSPRGPELDKLGRPASIEHNVRENFRQAHELLTPLVSEHQQKEVERYQLDFLSDEADRFAARVRDGHIVDGHGDLRLEHVYLGAQGKPLVIDCIEFNERFRIGDACSDVAFLAMDLAWRGHEGLAERFLAAYARHSNDYDLYRVADFYQSYRAYVRAKISALGLRDAPRSSSEYQVRAEAARRYFLLAQAFERPAVSKPRLIAVGGLIASGKSTVAALLEEDICAPRISSDRTRKHLLGVDALRPVPEGAFEGAYGADVSRRVYDEVLRRAEVVLRSGRSAVVDASFRTQASRRALQQLAANQNAELCFIECAVPGSVAQKRLEERARSASESDGRLSVYDEFVARYEPVSELPASAHLRLDTNANSERTRQRLSEWLLATR